MQNPFTLSFGKKPLQYISRIAQTNQIVETLSLIHIYKILKLEDNEDGTYTLYVRKVED